MTKPTQLCLLETSNLNHWSSDGGPAPKRRVFSFFWNIIKWTKSKNAIILNINHRQNLLASTFTCRLSNLCVSRLRTTGNVGNSYL